MDGFGGVHAGGALPGVQANPRTPYFGFNVARAIVYRNVPPRAAGSINYGGALLDVTLGAYATVSSATVVAPDDGFLVVVASANFGCSSVVASDLWAHFALGLDSTSAIAEATYSGYIGSCNYNGARESVAITRLFPVSAGAHTAHLLGRKVAATGATNVSVLRSSVVVLYVDQASDGSS